MLRFLVSALGRTEERGMIAETPLHIATFHGHEEVVKALLEHKADPTAKDDDQITVLQLAEKITASSVIQVALLDASKGKPVPPKRRGSTR